MKRRCTDPIGFPGGIALSAGVAAFAIVVISARWSGMFDAYDRSVIKRAIDLPGEWIWKRALRAD